MSCNDRGVESGAEQNWENCFFFCYLDLYTSILLAIDYSFIFGGGDYPHLSVVF